MRRSSRSERRAAAGRRFPNSPRACARKRRASRAARRSSLPPARPPRARRDERLELPRWLDSCEPGRPAARRATPFSPGDQPREDARRRRSRPEGAPAALPPTRGFRTYHAPAAAKTPRGAPPGARRSRRHVRPAPPATYGSNRRAGSTRATGATARGEAACARRASA